MQALFKWVALCISCVAVFVIGFEGSLAVKYLWNIRSIVAGEFRAVEPRPGSDSSSVTHALRVYPVFADTRDSAAATLNLSRGAALVLLFDTRCTACRDNMPRWLDLLARVQRAPTRLPVYAINLDSGDVRSAAGAAARYRHGVAAPVQVVQAAVPEAVRRAFSENRTPATIATRDGRILAIHAGAVGPWRQNFLLRTLGVR